MGTPFSLEGKLNLPGSPGLPQDPIPYALLAQYDSKAEYELKLPAGSGTQTVNFGTMPAAGVKAMLVVYEQAQNSPPILVTVNGGDEPIELTAGGFIAMGSPVPVNGVTSIDIAYTGAGRVQVWLLG